MKGNPILQDHDSCGTGVIFNKNNTSSHSIISRALISLCNMKHRGAVSYDGITPDGCGILIDLDRNYFRKKLLEEQNLILPNFFSVGVFFIKNNFDYQDIIVKICADFDIKILAQRELKVNKDILGELALKSCPKIMQIFFVFFSNNFEPAFEPTSFKIKKYFDNNFNPEKELYCVSLSSNSIIYKGLVLPDYFSKFYPDLEDLSHSVASATFHIRFSTNTSPKWHLAQPYRVLAHNGEINTISGNRNWATARFKNFESKVFGDLKDCFPLINQNGSDSSSLDNILELFTLGGIDIGRAARMLIPPSWQNTDLMDPDEKAFHEYNSMHMEAWDGPALICFQNKDFVSCFLDRNGLRPARIEYFNDDTVCVSSEVGSNEQKNIRRIATDRLGPGGLIVFDRN